LEIIVNYEFKIIFKLTFWAIFDNITNGGSRPPCAQPRKDENGVEEERADQGGQEETSKAKVSFGKRRNNH